MKLSNISSVGVIVIALSGVGFPYAHFRFEVRRRRR